MSFVVEKIDAALARRGRVSVGQFRRIIKEFYCASGRVFPWRKTTNSYRIAVSEVMLQQTQTERVLEKYAAFIKRFPSWRSLAGASTAEVLSSWQGLGYYRRALNLHRAAKIIVSDFKGRLPNELSELRALPGFGAYTAAAVLTFSTNKPHVMIETNIRDLYLYAFFSDQDSVSDKDVLKVVEETMDVEEPRTWFYALMDAGVELKKARKGVNRRSKHYSQQSAFIGSRRQVRAAVLKVLTQQGNRSVSELCGEVPFERERIKEAIDALCRDGFLASVGRGRYSLQ